MPTHQLFCTLWLLCREMNSLKLMVGDGTSAYLMAYTKEFILFRAGPEFLEKEVS
jgi:hypothetical protein